MRILGCPLAAPQESPTPVWAGNWKLLGRLKRRPETPQKETLPKKMAPLPAWDSSNFLLPTKMVEAQKV